MPLKEYQVSSYSELCSLLEKTQGEGEEIFLFFSCTLDKHGDPTTKTCFNAEDVLMEYTEYIRTTRRQLHLLYYRVMLEEYFKPDCEVAKDRDLRITTVPTLLKWKSYQRLSGLQCCKFPLLSMLFEVECPKKFPVFKPCMFFKPEEKAEEEEQPAPAEGENTSAASLNKDPVKDEIEKPEAKNPVTPEAAGEGQNIKTPSDNKPATENIVEAQTTMKDQTSNPKE